MILIAFCLPSSFVQGLTLTLLLCILEFLEPSFTLRENKEQISLKKFFFALTLYLKVAIEIHQI